MKAKVVAIGVDATPGRAVVIVECAAMTLHYEILRAVVGGGGTHVANVRLFGDGHVPHREGVAAARRAADAAMTAKQEQLDIKHPLLAAYRRARNTR